MNSLLSSTYVIDLDNFGANPSRSDEHSKIIAERTCTLCINRLDTSEACTGSNIHTSFLTTFQRAYKPFMTCRHPEFESLLLFPGQCYERGNKVRAHGTTSSPSFALLGTLRLHRNVSDPSVEASPSAYRSLPPSCRSVSRLAPLSTVLTNLGPRSMAASGTSAEWPDVVFKRINPA